MSESYWEKPIGDWTLEELAAGAGSAGQLRDEAAARGEHELADGWQQVALLLAGHRDDRRRLAREVDEAMNPFKVLGGFFGPDTPETDPE